MVEACHRRRSIGGRASIISAMPFVPGYTHTPGHHCGSTALRNLLAFDGVEISEEMAFGLGAGPCFYYVTLEEASPTRWFNGRTARLEENFSELTGSALEMRTFEEGDGEAWEAARASVDAGRPALLLTDIYHLDHYGNSARFPGHAVVLAGYDEEVAHLSDTGFEVLQTTALESLDRARHGEHPAYPLAGHMFTTSEAIDAGRLREAIPAAIERAAKAMIEPEFREFSGLDAVHRLAAEAGSWPEAAEDWKWCARFGYQVIERRGHGRRLLPADVFALPRGGRAGRGATGRRRRGPLDASSPGPSRSPASRRRPVASHWAEIDDAARRVGEAEDRLWSALAAS